MNDKLLDLVKTIINSDLPLFTRNAIVSHYMLPKDGARKAPIEDERTVIEGVDRPSREDIEIENNPKMKAEFADTERGLTGHTDLDDDDDE